MALLDFEKKEGLQYGTVGDECYHCRRNRNPEEVYEPKSLDRQLVYKLKIYGNEYCLCEECFEDKYALCEICGQGQYRTWCDQGSSGCLKK